MVFCANIQRVENAMSNVELECFKTEINLTEYAAAQGYLLDRKESSRNSVSMRNPVSGDKIIIARGQDDHWIYFSVRDDRDNGSIIDFVQKRQGGSLGVVRKVLRVWLGTGYPKPAPDAFIPRVEKTTRDKQSVIAKFNRMRNVEEHPYLKTRAVGKEILSLERFYGRVRIDQRGNAVFPHFDRQGLCGFEIKNKDFTGFSPGGEKGLWESHVFPKDNRLVIAESAIDALSFHALHGTPHTRYVSTAGGWDKDKTPDLIRKAAEECPGLDVILAFDNDEQGHEYETLAKQYLAESEKRLISSFPTALKTDWNDILKSQMFPTPLFQKVK